MHNFCLYPLHHVHKWFTVCTAYSGLIFHSTFQWIFTNSETRSFHFAPLVTRFPPIQLDIRCTQVSLRCRSLNPAMGLGGAVSPQWGEAEPRPTTHFRVQKRICLAAVLSLCYAVQIIMLGQNARTAWTLVQVVVQLECAP